MKKAAVILSAISLILSGCQTTGITDFFADPAVLKFEQTPSQITLTFDEAPKPFYPDGYDIVYIAQTNHGTYNNYNHELKYTKTSGVYTVEFPMRGMNLPDDTCFRIFHRYESRGQYYKRTLHPKGNKSWCIRKLEASEQLPVLKAEITKIESEYSREKQQLDSLMAKTTSFPSACRFPEPLTTPAPAAFCSNPEKIKKKRVQCMAPIIKLGCNLTADEFMNLDTSMAERAAVPAACMLGTNEALEKPTTGGDIIGAGIQSLLTPLKGKKGVVADLLSGGFAYLRYKGCESSVYSACNPSPPTPPNCSSWKKHQDDLASTSNKVEWLEYSLSQKEKELSAFRTDTIVQRFDK